jgi:hypothetical protein
MDSPSLWTERFSLCPGVGEASYAIDDDSFEDAAVRIEFPDNFDAMACVIEFCTHVPEQSTRVRGKNQSKRGSVLWLGPTVDSTTQAQILADFDRRWLADPET